MATFHLGRKIDPTEEGYLSLSPDWMLCVIRFKHLSTFSREKMASLSTDGSEAAAEKGEPLIITSDCVSLSTSSSKGSHVKNLVATLMPGGTNYLSEIMPGDWLFAWMVQDEDKSADIARRIRAGEACNNFDDGLKFVGRVYSISKSLSIDPNSGKKQLRYSLQGNAFNEFNTSVFWDQYLSVAQPLIKTWMGNLGLAMDKFLSQDGIDINGAMPELLELLFGRGISKKAANPDGAAALQIVTGLTEGEGEAPFAYVVPSTVGKLLGRRSRSKKSGVLAYADILREVFGVQKYQNLGADFQTDVDESIGTSLEGGAAGSLFQPTELKPMLGKFLPHVPTFSGKTVWSILGTFLNGVVNEMYTCLRVDGAGKILPTIVVRQLPFTSSVFEGDTRTSFLELPRWKAPESMLMTYQVGRSDALRFNFVHLTGQAVAQAQNNVFTFQLVRTPPRRDDQDIRRSGLRPDIQSVACGIEDQQLGPKKWMDIRADILMGQHLTLTGTISMFGVEEPICEGDNFEVDGVVFHIESVMHTASISEDGKKRFMTTLQVTHGMRSDDPDAPAPVAAPGDDRIYTATSPEDLTGNDPGDTYEGQDEAPERQPSGAFGDFFDGSTGDES